MNTEIFDFLVQGSAKEPYKVNFIKQEGHEYYAALCNCKAGSMGQVCKHRMNIFSGKTEDIVEGSLSDAKMLAQWYKGSHYEKINARIKEQEKVVKKAQSKLRSTKRELQQWMHDIKTE